MTRDLLVADFGKKDYLETWNLQKELVRRKILAELSDLVILVEHPDVITLGRKGKLEDVLTSQIPVYPVERGGEVTYHGPGQLVGYPLIDLRSRSFDVLGHLRGIEETLILTLKEFGLPAERKEGHTGVWVSDRKVASIGVAVRGWISFHGFALNVNTDLRKFQLIRPCGLQSDVITSMRALLGKEVALTSAKKKFVENFSAVFNYSSTIHVDEYFVAQEILVA